eukprot:COSAG01_NODE_2063_length_8512_cov_7.924284_11_plen_56_part_01
MALGGLFFDCWRQGTRLASGVVVGVCVCVCVAVCVCCLLSVMAVRTLRSTAPDVGW